MALQFLGFGLNMEQTAIALPQVPAIVNPLKVLTTGDLGSKSLAEQVTHRFKYKSGPMKMTMKTIEMRMGFSF